MTPILPLLLAFTQPAEAFAPSPRPDLGLLPDPSTTTLPKSLPEALPKSVPTSNNLGPRIFSRVVSEIEEVVAERIVTKSVQPPKSALAYAGVVALLAVGAGVHLSWRNSFYTPTNLNHGPAPDFSKSPLGFTHLPSPMTASPLGDDSISISSPEQDYQAKQDSLKAWGDRNFKIALMKNMIQILELAGISGAALGQLKTQLQELESQAVATDGGGNRASKTSLPGIDIAAEAATIDRLGARVNKDLSRTYTEVQRVHDILNLLIIAYTSDFLVSRNKALIVYNSLTSELRYIGIEYLPSIIEGHPDSDYQLIALSILVDRAKNDTSPILRGFAKEDLIDVLKTKKGAIDELKTLISNPFINPEIKSLMEQALTELEATSNAQAKQ